MLNGLDLMFMGVTGSNSGLFSIPGFLVSPNSNMLDPKAVAGEAEKQPNLYHRHSQVIIR